MRVIPRDLFNESMLLKCVGKLTLASNPPIAPGVALEWNKEKPIGTFKKYAFDVPEQDVDREYCTGYNHGLILAESVIEEAQPNTKAQREARSLQSVESDPKEGA